MLEAIFSSIGYAGGVVADKIILGRYKIPVMRFIPLLFIWLAVITAVFLPIWGSADYSLIFSRYYIGLLVLLIIVAVTWNIYYYQGIQKENLAEFELIMLFTELIGMAKLMLLAPCTIATLIPTTFPFKSSSGPPEFPKLIGAVVCIIPLRVSTVPLLLEA